MRALALALAYKDGVIPSTNPKLSEVTIAVDMGKLIGRVISGTIGW
jgi:hypothetical protein